MIAKKVMPGRKNVPRHKTVKNCPLLPWQSLNLDCREDSFSQFGQSLFLTRKDEHGNESNEFLKLTSGERLLYLCMVIEAKRKRTFKFTLACARKYGFSSSSFRKELQTLINKGFITRQSGRVTREPNIFEFCFDWKPHK